ncbi:MAG: hypothetical protein CME17_09430, partial [Gemmatimonadetes bacterium]|nr:hypothetical protein [Gemmatimonadota bacterium]
MCKLFGVTSTIGWERKTLQATLNAAQAAFGQSEKDGFGFAVRTSRGIYSEKYTSPKSFLGIGSGRKGLANFASIRSGVDYDTETKGKLSKLTGGLIVHGRTSTNAGGILNTHPFIRKGWALAHNGIVDY